MPGVRTSSNGDDADKRVRLLLRLHRLRRPAASEAWRLLCLLFVRQRRLSTDSASRVVLCSTAIQMILARSAYAEAERRQFIRGQELREANRAISVYCEARTTNVGVDDGYPGSAGAYGLAAHADADEYAVRDHPTFHHERAGGAHHEHGDANVAALRACARAFQ